jgi:hypothetical protein
LRSHVPVLSLPIALLKVKFWQAFIPASMQPASLLIWRFLRFLPIATILLKLYAELTGFYTIELPYETRVINNR